jgi:hypothetical protein
VREQKTGKVFRTLTDEHYTTTIRKSEAEMRKYLTRMGFLPLPPKQLRRKCFKCGALLNLVSWKDRQVLKHPGKKCRVTLPADRAYLPLYDSSLSWRDYYMLLACFCYQLRVDQTVFFSGVGDNGVAKYFNAFRDVAAWWVLERIGWVQHPGFVKTRLGPCGAARFVDGPRQVLAGA